MLEPEFWKKKSLEEMSDEEWEAVCDGCAKCCLEKFEDEDTDELHFSNIHCRYLNTKTCGCTQYKERTHLVPTCVKITKENIGELYYMPPSCGYRLLSEGKDLPSWHPVRHKGKKSAMHKAGMSVRGKIIHEDLVDDFEDHIVTWPLDMVE